MVDALTPLPAGLSAYQYDSSAGEENGQEGGQVSTFNSQGYPKREGSEQCAFFVKNGTCQFGVTCKWHHPEFIYPGVDFNSRGFPLRPGQPDCEYYQKHQECKYGCTCKNNHPEITAIPANMVPKQKPMMGVGMGIGMGNPRGAVPGVPAMGGMAMGMAMGGMPGGMAMGMRTGAVAQAGLNSKGFPLRPGATPCQFFLRTDTCKFGATCQFDHPEGVTGVASIAKNPLAGFHNAQPDGFNSKGYPIRIGAQICAFFAKTGECKFSETCKFDHTEGAEPEQASVVSNSLGLPIRPGQPQCAFFVKTGTCSYGVTCKFDHPEEYTVLAQGAEAPPKKPPVAKAQGFNSAGLPIRAGAEPCSFYLKTGQCSFGASCRWDHPEGAGGSQPQGVMPEKARFAPLARATPY